MNIQIVMSGTPSLSFAKVGIEEYLKRSSRFGNVELISIKENKDHDKKRAKILEGTDVILCDEKGKEYTTEELASFIDQKTQNGTKTLSFLIGGPDGHPEHIRALYGQTLSLSQLTLPHDLAVLFLTENIYRASTINAGHPYHRP